MKMNTKKKPKLSLKRVPPLLGSYVATPRFSSTNIYSEYSQNGGM